MKIHLPLVLIVLTASLSACSPASAIPEIDSAQTYRGYPCFNQCEAFKQGYDQAQAQRYTSPSACEALADSRRNGCRSYVTDFKVDTQQNGGLYLAPNSPQSLP